MAEDSLLLLYLEEISGFVPVSDSEARRLALVRADGAKAASDLATGNSDPAQFASLRRRVAGEKATKSLVEAHLGLAVDSARAYLSSGLPLLDLVQEANLGLLHAVETFSPGGELSFSEHGKSWMMQAIEAGLATDDV